MYKYLLLKIVRNKSYTLYNFFYQICSFKRVISGIFLKNIYFEVNKIYSMFSNITFTYSCGKALAKLSGSCPSGNSITLIFMPSSKSKSILLNEALIPAASPSNRIVTLGVNLLISLICSLLKQYHYWPQHFLSLPDAMKLHPYNPPQEGNDFL